MNCNLSVLMMAMTFFSATALASEQSSTASAPATLTHSAIASIALPDGVMTDPNPLKQKYLAQTTLEKMLFRPSINMPEITNKGYIDGLVDSETATASPDAFIGYIPKLKVLPCAKGCEGDDYEEAVKSLKEGYHSKKDKGKGQVLKERGELIVQVRWFNRRTFLGRQVPLSADWFGVSFLLEGKLISIGRVANSSVDDIAEIVGSRLVSELVLAVGMGVKPSYLHLKRDPGTLADAAKALRTGITAFNSVFGTENVRSRVEPATEANNNLLPAIDGILPGEIEPITEIKYFNGFVY